MGGGDIITSKQPQTLVRKQTHKKHFHSRSKQLAKVTHIHQEFSIITLDSTKTHIFETHQVKNTRGQKQLAFKMLCVFVKYSVTMENVQV